jgi:hypothetical protein
MITASTEGRNLHLTVEGIDEPFIVKPLPGNAGYQLTDTFLRTNVGQASPDEMSEALAMALDGGVKDGDRWVAVRDELRFNSKRLGDDVSLGEAEDIAMAALMWQTVLQDVGVNIYLSSGGGVEGLSKATGALVARMGLSSQLTSPSSALESLIQLQGSIPSTSSHPDGAKPGKQPQDRRPKQPRQNAR